MCWDKLDHLRSTIYIDRSMYERDKRSVFQRNKRNSSVHPSGYKVYNKSMHFHWNDMKISWNNFTEFLVHPTYLLSQDSWHFDPIFLKSFQTIWMSSSRNNDWRCHPIAKIEQKKIDNSKVYHWIHVEPLNNKLVPSSRNYFKVAHKGQ